MNGALLVPKYHPEKQRIFNGLCVGPAVAIKMGFDQIVMFVIVLLYSTNQTTSTVC